jgi:vacuolar protein sorting-associated protein 13A/C
MTVQLERSVSKPLAVPSPTQPLQRCDAYSRVWCSSGTAPPATLPSVSAGTLTVSATGRGGVDPWTASRGVSVWRPQPPNGYLSLGDVAVPGAAASPQFTVAVMAVNSGLVAWPQRFELCWDAGDGLVLWRPIPAPGYVAMGLVASRSVTEAPDAQQVACVRSEALVEARCSQCVLLCAAGNLWSVANCGATMVASSPDAHHPPAHHLMDLRLPLGVAPAALTPASAVMLRPANAHAAAALRASVAALPSAADLSVCDSKGSHASLQAAGARATLPAYAISQKLQQRCVRLGALGCTCALFSTCCGRSLQE